MGLDLKSLLPARLSSGDGAATEAPEFAQDLRDEDLPDEVIEGRAEFTHVFGDLAKGKRNWQLIAFGLTALLLLVTGGFVEQVMTARIETHIIEVDELGRAQVVGQTSATPSETAIRAQLSLFIRNVRSVYSDPIAQREMVMRGFAFTGSDARDFLNSYFGDPENDPRRLAKDFSRTANVQSIIAVPGTDTYRAQWTEAQVDRTTDQREQAAWEGYLTVEVQPPRTVAALEENPLGIIITDLSWSPVTAAN